MAIRQRGPERFELIVYVGRDGAGKRRAVSRVFHGTEKAARDAEKLLYGEVVRGKASPGDHTLDELLTDWLRTCESNLAYTTARRYRTLIENHIRPALGRKRLSKLRVEDLDRFYGAKLEALATATVRQMHAILHRALYQAEKWAWIPQGSNPAALTNKPQVRRAEIVPPSPEDLRRLHQQVLERDPELAAFIFVATTTGARRGELCALRWPKVDLDGGAVHITLSAYEMDDGTVALKEPKTHQCRVIALDRATVEVLRRHRARMETRAADGKLALAPDAFVFSASPTGAAPWVPDDVTDAFRRARDKAGLKLRMYDLRHFAITQALAAGVPVRTVAGRAGHRAEMTLSVYGHFVPASDRHAADVVGELMSVPGRAEAPPSPSAEGGRGEAGLVERST